MLLFVMYVVLLSHRRVCICVRRHWSPDWPRVEHTLLPRIPVVLVLLAPSMHQGRLATCCPSDHIRCILILTLYARRVKRMHMQRANGEPQTPANLTKITV